MNLLIIDDDHIGNCVTHRLAETSRLFTTIRTLKYEKHALEFLEQAESDLSLKPDLIILNFGMQDISPVDLFKALRDLIAQSTKRIYLAILTLTTDPKVVECIRDMGLQPYLLKPFSSPDLHAMVYTFKV